MITYELKTLDNNTYTFYHKKDLLLFIEKNRAQVLGFYKLKNDSMINFCTHDEILKRLETYTL
jgi:hypothetical protein